MHYGFGDFQKASLLDEIAHGAGGQRLRRRLQSLGIQEVLTARQNPWQNAYAERLIGSIRRECLNHFNYSERPVI
jgi:transposase InsO family protein